MKIVLISDTHSLHSLLDIPECDILIHSGDCVMSHDQYQMVYKNATSEFIEWLNGQTQAKNRLFIGGNHDFILRDNEEWVRDQLNPGTHYLLEESIEIDGLKIFGTPWQPYFYDWAFNTHSDEEMKSCWSKIPEDVDILVTHNPPKYVLDGHGNYGCPFLYDNIFKNKMYKNLKIHTFGHIHKGRGHKRIDEIDFYNSSNVDNKYNIVHDPFVLEI